MPPDASTITAGIVRPQVVAENWRPLFTPRVTGCYVNDHTVFRDPRTGRWHVIGITRAESQVRPDHERHFCHGSGPSLAAGNFQEHDPVCDFGERAWAPTVVHDGRRFVMLFGPDIMRAAVADEAGHWRQTPVTVTGCPVDGNIRDQMIFRLDDDTWLMYATSLRGGYSAISVFVSEDLLHWRFVRYAFRTTSDAPLHPPWGATESPFVFVHEGCYHLATTYTDSLPGSGNYHNTLIFRSKNPFDFGVYTGDDVHEVFARLSLHAPEFLCDPDTGNWMVTSCGWHGEGYQPVIPGSVAITELNWS